MKLNLKKCYVTTNDSNSKFSSGIDMISTWLILVFYKPQENEFLHLSSIVVPLVLQ